MRSPATTRTRYLTPRGDNLVLADTRLLFYYQNRLAAHGLAAGLPSPPRLGLGGLNPLESPTRDDPWTLR